VLRREDGRDPIATKVPIPKKGDRRMAYYLLQLAYTPEGWAAQLQNPQDRVEAGEARDREARGERRERLSGVRRVRRGAPVPVSRQPAAFSIAVSSSDAIKAFKTTPLMTIDESLEAIRAAAEAGYRPPDG
jgi:hypothetical protein